MKYYAFIKNDRKIGLGQCPMLNEGVINAEITKEIFDDCLEHPLKYIAGEVEKEIDGQIVTVKTLVLNPNWEQEEAAQKRIELDKLSLTKREVFLALYRDKGLTPEQLRTQIQDAEALIEFDYATVYLRGNPLINQIGQMLGYTTEQLDYLFEHKELPQEIENENTDN